MRTHDPLPDAGGPPEAPVSGRFHALLDERFAELDGLDDSARAEALHELAAELTAAACSAARAALAIRVPA